MSELPIGWRSIRFEDLNEFISQTINPANSPRTTFTLYSVPSYPSGDPERVLGRDVGSTKQVVAHNDVLICKINPSINRVWRVFDKQLDVQIASSEWIVLRSKVADPRFLQYLFRSSRFREMLCADVTGVGGSLTRAQPKRVATIQVPLAPLA